MRLLKTFEEFLSEGIAGKRTADKARAESLVSEAKERKKFLDELSAKIKVSDENANYFIENCYDALIELIRAKLLKDGYKSSGEGAHEAEVSYLRKLGFEEKDVLFMNDLRYFRNGILYYGKSFDSDYADKALEFLKKNFDRLLKINQSQEGSK